MSAGLRASGAEAVSQGFPGKMPRMLTKPMDGLRLVSPW